MYTFADLIFASYDPPRRLAAIDNAAARKIGATFILLFYLIGALRGVLSIVETLIVSGPEDDLLNIGMMLVWWLTYTLAFFHVRDEFTSLISRTWSHLKLFGRPIADLAHFWPFLASALALTSAVAGIGLILGLERDAGFSGSLLIFFLTPFVVGGIGALKKEKLAGAAPERRPALEGWFALAEGGAIIIAAALLLKAGTSTRSILPARPGSQASRRRWCRRPAS